MPLSLEERVAAALAPLLAPLPAAPLGIAVSGGGDSIALLHLLRRALPDQPLHVATVDHGLRPEARAEAQLVADGAARLGLSHDLLDWKWDGRGNLQDRARQGRQALLGAWAEARGCAAVCLGHSRDDQAETLLMRLGRGAGVDGLAAMAPATRLGPGPLWLRPLLGLGREELRDWLRGEGIPWIDDPSNEDGRFDRVRARRLLAAGADLGLEAESLAATARRMGAARAVLGQVAAAAADDLAQAQAGAIGFGAGLWDLAEETRWRLLSAALCLVSGQSYRPNFAPLLAAEAEARAGRIRSLHGCLLVPQGDRLWCQAEPKALEALCAPAPGPWAGWEITGPAVPGAEIRMLGASGLAQCEDWRAGGLPHRLALTTPGVFVGETLIAAPLLHPSDWGAQSRVSRGALTAMLLSH